jgi:hypothetical protein
MPVPSACMRYGGIQYACMCFDEYLIMRLTCGTSLKKPLIFIIALLVVSIFLTNKS